jgi:hypothetical protein
MDYFMASLAWELDLRDLKKLSLNGINYSSVDDEKKELLRDIVFPGKWKQFV